MKIVKFLIISLVSIALLIAVGIGIFTTITDPNDHKEFITSGFNQATGRELSIAGDIQFTLFPKLGIQLGHTQVSNAKGFSQPTFAQLDNVIIRADLLSLLMFKLQADTIELQGLHINLEKNQAGFTNWQDLIAETVDQSADASVSNDTSSIKSPLGIEVAGIKVSDARLVYEDASSKNTMTIDNVNLTTGAIGHHQFSPINATLRVSQTRPKSVAELSLSSDIMLDMKHMKLQMREMELKLNAQTPLLPEPGIKVVFNTQMEWDLGQEHLSLSDMQVSINDTEFNGQLTVKSFAKPSIEFSFNADEIDVDQLMLVASTSSSDVPANDVIELPVQQIRQMTVQGGVAIKLLRASGLELTDLKSTLSIQQGIAQVADLTFHLYEGDYSGAAMLDVRKVLPVYSASSQLKGLAIGELLQAMSDNERSLIKGQTELDFNIQTSGKRVSDLKKKLKGEMSFRAAEGALQNKNLAKNIEYVVAFLQGRSPKVSGEEILFDSFSGSSVINDGILSNKDLALVAPLIAATGHGRVDLASERIAYTLNVGMAGEDSKKLPIKITGPLADPKYKFDIKSVITGRQKQKIEAKKQQLKEKLLDGGGNILGDDLKKKIKKFKLF